MQCQDLKVKISSRPLQRGGGRLRLRGAAVDTASSTSGGEQVPIGGGGRGTVQADGGDLGAEGQVGGG